MEKRGPSLIALRGGSLLAAACLLPALAPGPAFPKGTQVTKAMTASVRGGGLIFRTPTPALIRTAKPLLSSFLSRSFPLNDRLRRAAEALPADDPIAAARLLPLWSALQEMKGIEKLLDSNTVSPDEKAGKINEAWKNAERGIRYEAERAAAGAAEALRGGPEETAAALLRLRQLEDLYLPLYLAQDDPLRGSISRARGLLGAKASLLRAAKTRTSLEHNAAALDRWTGAAALDELLRPVEKLKFPVSAFQVRKSQRPEPESERLKQELEVQVQFPEGVEYKALLEEAGLRYLHYTDFGEVRQAHALADPGPASSPEARRRSVGRAIRKLVRLGRGRPDIEGLSISMHPEVLKTFKYPQAVLRPPLKPRPGEPEKKAAAVVPEPAPRPEPEAASPAGAEADMGKISRLPPALASGPKNRLFVRPKPVEASELGLKRFVQEELKPLSYIRSSLGDVELRTKDEASAAEAARRLSLREEVLRIEAHPEVYKLLEKAAGAKR